ncbi:MAG: hypothetical protein WEE03_02775 [Chloroflexota bacterium]
MTHAAVSVAVVAPFIVLILAWGFGLIPALALLPLATAPLAMRLGDNVAQRAHLVRDAVVFALAFVALLAVGLSLEALPDLG